MEKQWPGALLANMPFVVLFGSPCICDFPAEMSIEYMKGSRPTTFSSIAGLVGTQSGDYLVEAWHSGSVGVTLWCHHIIASLLLAASQLLPQCPNLEPIWGKDRVLPADLCKGQRIVACPARPRLKRATRCCASKKVCALWAGKSDWAHTWACERWRALRTSKRPTTVRLGLSSSIFSR